MDWRILLPAIGVVVGFAVAVAFSRMMRTEPTIVQSLNRDSETQVEVDPSDDFKKDGALKDEDIMGTNDICSKV